MGIANRTKDVSEQYEHFTIFQSAPSGTSAIPTGTTLYCSTIVPRACTIVSAQMTCFGISGAPQALLSALRFGSSFATFLIGTTGLIPSNGVSGFMPYSLGAAGATTLNLQKGDVLICQQLGGSGAATTTTIIDIVVQNLQDFRSWY